jgi:hypothetical protein
MAKRPAAFKSQLGSQLGSILTRTWQQLEGVREVVVQKTKEGRLQIDLTLLRRKRQAALASLGEVVARLARSGRIDEDDFPELSGPLASVQDVEERIEREETRARRAAAGLEDDIGYEDGDREEYDEDDDDDLEGAVRAGGARRTEFSEDGAREAAGRRLHGELDYDVGEGGNDAEDDDDDDGRYEPRDDDDDDDAVASPTSRRR